MNVAEETINVSVKTAGQFVFPTSSVEHQTSLLVGDDVLIPSDYCCKAVGVETLYKFVYSSFVHICIFAHTTICSCFCASPGVDSNLINKEWFANHYKWIIWKLASYEVCFPEVFGGR